ncbi:hypothetical protein V3W47_06745 [Deinococcus sp. YIM 134068]|uniref:hypothetical protein n=1 Tax=Deinococcus lichenicola TaxID=3118910 RepID=UPI002F946D53
MNTTDTATTDTADAARHTQREHKLLIREVRGLQASLRELVETDHLEELLRIIPRPGWTTPAEFVLVRGGVAQMRAQVEALKTFQEQVVRGADLVGRAG